MGQDYCVSDGDSRWYVLTVSSGLDTPGRGEWACMSQVACAVRQRLCSPKPYRATPTSITFSAASPLSSVHQLPFLPCPRFPYRFSLHLPVARVMGYVRIRLWFHDNPVLLPLLTGLKDPTPHCVSVGKPFENSSYTLSS